MSSEIPTALPAEWVTVIFDKCSLTYGRRFMQQWEDVDADRVRADWAHELAGFAHWPAAISYALQHLPADLPFTVQHFRKLARQVPPEVLPALSYAPASRETREAALAALSARSEDRPVNREWARRIVARRAAGEHIAPLVLSMAKDALRFEREAQEPGAQA